MKYIRSHKILLAVIVIVLIIAALAINKYSNKKMVTAPGTGQSQTTISTGGINKLNGSAAASSGATSSIDSSAGPRQPSGSFVSSHKVKLSDSLESNCSTSPGVSCNILFISGNTTKSLGPKTTNAIGDAIWAWKPQDVGITEGPWQISAVATANGKTATTQDSLVLQVGP